MGQSSGPPPPPAVKGSRVDILSDPQKPGPGEVVVITVTVSGSNGGTDRYAVPKTKVDLQLTERPDALAILSPTTLTTDVTGSAATKLTLSTTKGRHVVTATSNGVSAHAVFDTLAGSIANASRARHSAGVIATPVAPLVNPSYLLMAAAFFLVGGFLVPALRRLSSGRKNRAAPGSAEPGG